MADSDGGLLGREVTRRDVVNATLIGAGAALLDGCAPTPKEAVDPWTGPGGVGDYADANGNTAAIVRAAHGIRDGDYEARIAAAVDTGETVDMLIVGGGFGGLGAMLAFKARHPTGTCLLLDNQAVIGGYAKANAFDVDGHRITGAQASMNFTLPTDETRGDSYWPELGLPDDPRWVSRTGGDPAIVVQRSTSGTLYHGEQSATMGYHGARGWAKDMWRDDLATAPIDPAFQRSLLTLRDLKRRGRPTGAEALRLDAMTFADYARELKLDPAVLPYVTLGMCQTGPQVSAYAALSLPGIDRYAPGSAEAVAADRFVAFPGGNAAIARHFVKALVPDAIGGPRTTEGIANGRFDPAALDRRGARLRLRSGALVVRVAHDGDPATAGAVAVTYAKDGKLFRVRAKAVVMTTGQWVTKHVVADLPETHRAALDRFLFAPMLVINVALRNWRFLDRLGFAAARWFDGFGFYATIRQPMALGGQRPALRPRISHRDDLLRADPESRSAAGGAGAGGASAALCDELCRL